MDTGVFGTLAIVLVLVGVLAWGRAASRRSALARVTVQGAAVVVEPLGIMKVLALASRIVVPIDHVLAAECVLRPQDDERPGLRLPGTSMPGLLAGTFVGPEGRSFWLVGLGETAVRLDLDDEIYSYLVLDVADPRATMREIYRADRP